MERWVSSNSWDCGYAISPQDPDVHVAHSPASLIGKVRHCLYLFWGGKIVFFNMESPYLKGEGSLSPLSLWFFCPRMQQSMLMSGLPALLSLHLGPKRWNPNQILNFQKLWNMLHKPQRNFDQKFTACLYFLPFSSFFFFISQLYFSQCEIQTDLHPGCTPSGTDETVFGCW